ncbi:MAG TPA: ABC transporter permease [Vicinamibacterales bacterium]
MWTGLLALASRLRALFTARALDVDFESELRDHLDSATEENIRRGMTPETAAREARLRLGGVTQLQEAHREQRGLPQVDTIMQDLRYALRTLRKNPAFSIVAVLTLTIGIGATTSMFSVLHAVLLRPLPYAQPDRLVEIFEVNPLKRWTRNVASAANYADWRRMNTVFTDVAATNGSGDKGEGTFDVFLTGNGEPQRLKVLQTTGNFFQVLGAGPMLGRSFTEEETYDGHQRVVILSYPLWRSLFAADPAVVGHPVTLSGRTYTVVGVMPPSFFYPSHDIQLWMPVGYKPNVFTAARRPHWLRVIARLKPGVSLDRAKADMTAVAAQLEKTYPDTNTQMGVRLEGLHDAFAFDARPALLVLFAAVGSVFLIVCVNVANLQLGRAAGRTREMAIRRALGAGRGRLVRQLVTEGVLLSALGGGFGLLLAAVARRILVALAATSLPLFAQPKVDRAVVLFAVVLSLLAPILFGLAPAVVSARAGTLGERGESTSSGHTTMRSALVMCEVALAVILVVAAGLLVRSLVLLQRVDPGFDADHAVSFQVQLPPARYPDDTKTLAAVETIERRLREQPGFESVGVGTTLALKGFSWTGDTTVEGRAPTDYERELRHEATTPDYFRTLGTRLVRGRWLNETDRPPRPPVTLVNETLAKRYFRGDDAIGKRISFGKPTDKPDWVTIVGIVQDFKQDGMDDPVQPEVYVPLAQDVQNPVTFVIRSRLEPEGVVSLARAQVRAVDKDLLPTDVTTLDALVRKSVDGQRFRTWLLGSFAGIALLLAALGIYGVLAYFVAQRVRELGIRLALGASPAQVWRMVVRQGMRPVLWGSIAGLAAAYAAADLMKSLLFGVAPLDPATYLTTAGALALIGAIACAVPALRAVRVDPLVALRNE